MDRRRELGDGGDAKRQMRIILICLKPRAVIDLSECTCVLCTCCCKQINYKKQKNKTVYITVVVTLYVCFLRVIFLIMFSDGWKCFCVVKLRIGLSFTRQSCSLRPQTVRLTLSAKDVDENRKEGFPPSFWKGTRFAKAHLHLA